MNPPDSFVTSDPRRVLDSLNDGVYVTDRDRRIVYWSESAARITGWQASDILGKECSDDLLCHTDKDGHRLCGEEHCPLHRAMMTGQGSTSPVVLFADGKDGRKVPMRVSVAPVRDATGAVVGGVETFQDLSAELGDFQRVRRIQSLTLSTELPQNSHIRVTAHYVPQDVVGGDYYAVTELDANRYAFLLADVSGHGVTAALYTMYLDSLWQRYQHLLPSPRAFAEAVGASLCDLIREEESFAAGICGVIDLPRGQLRLAGSGNPAPIVVRNGAGFESLDCRGLPLGCFRDTQYDEVVVELQSGDCVLLFTDGAIEISLPDGGLLGAEGLVAILSDLGYPGSGATLPRIEEELLRRSDRIRFDDDLTLLEARIV
jgi:PAS domain S-box-containing protein